MFNRFFLFLFAACLFLEIASCSSQKIACPTYADSAPSKKKHGKPGSQKPDIPRVTRSKSGVLPTDGHHSSAIKSSRHKPSKSQSYKGKAKVK